MRRFPASWTTTPCSTQGLLDLYEAQFDLRHLELAMRLTEKQRELFEDTRAGGFFSTAADDQQAGAAREGGLRWRRALRAIRWR